MITIMSTSPKKPDRFRVEIGLTLVLKVLLLWLLWWVCFSHPITEEARAQAVARILLTPAK